MERNAVRITHKAVGKRAEYREAVSERAGNEQATNCEGKIMLADQSRNP